MKKIVIIAMLAVLAFSVCGCSKRPTLSDEGTQTVDRMLDHVEEWEDPNILYMDFFKDDEGVKLFYKQWIPNYPGADIGTAKEFIYSTNTPIECLWEGNVSCLGGAPGVKLGSCWNVNWSNEAKREYLTKEYISFQEKK